MERKRRKTKTAPRSGPRAAGRKRAKTTAKPRTKPAAKPRPKKAGAGPRKMKAYATFDLYFADQSAKNQPILHALRRFVARAAPGLRESVKWGNGCWLAGKGPVAYVYAAEDHVQFGFLRGSALADPKGLLEGQGQYVRHVKLRRPADLDRRACAALLAQAVRLGPPTG